MSFIKRLFGGGDKKAEASKANTGPAMRGSEPLQSAAQIDSTRNNMEAEMQADRARRQAIEDAKAPPAKQE